jgi:hypothetical protein
MKKSGGNKMQLEPDVIKWVRYIHFPDTSDGRLGFYHEPTDIGCVSPRYTYHGIGNNKDKIIGYCHIENAEQMNELALKYRAMTREEIQLFRATQGEATWKDAYSMYLSRFLGDVLQTEQGIVWLVKHQLVRFKCRPGEFVVWSKGRK